MPPNVSPPNRFYLLLFGGPSLAAASALTFGFTYYFWRLPIPETVGRAISLTFVSSAAVTAGSSAWFLPGGLWFRAGIAILLAVAGLITFAAWLLIWGAVLGSVWSAWEH